MPAIITDTFDYDDIVRVLDLDEAFVQHQVDARTLNELIRLVHCYAIRSKQLHIYLAMNQANMNIVKAKQGRNMPSIR